MHIKRLTINNFRNYEKQTIDFNRQFNIFFGDNGQGKTNLLEALYVSALSKSFRQCTDKDLIRHNEKYYYIKTDFYNENNEHNFIEVAYDGKNKKIRLNNNVVKRFADLIGELKIIIFSGNDIELVFGYPDVRRKFIDSTLSLTDKTYLSALKQYSKVVKERNACLKQSKDFYKIYNEKLAYFGSQVIKKRLDFLCEIKDKTIALYQEIQQDRRETDIIYKSSLPYLEKVPADSLEGIFMDTIDKKRGLELKFKQTQVGPHKDDLVLKSGNELFKKVASSGQSRSMVLALFLSKLSFIEKLSQEKAVLLLDDVLLELDKKKKTNFIDVINDNQCFFTMTNLDEVSPIKDKASIFKIENGEIK